MFHFLRGIVLIAAMMASCGVAFAQDRFSANYKMVGCRAFLVPGTQIPTIFDEGVCTGIVQGLVYAAPGVCVPDGSTIGQWVRVVVQYIDDRPARLHEDFKALAVEALRAAWPCKN